MHGKIDHGAGKRWIMSLRGYAGASFCVSGQRYRKDGMESTFAYLTSTKQALGGVGGEHSWKKVRRENRLLGCDGSRERVGQELRRGLLPMSNTKRFSCFSCDVKPAVGTQAARFRRKKAHRSAALRLLQKPLPAVAVIRRCY